MTAPAKPPREYVGLLTEVMTNTLDEDYATVAARRRTEAGSVDESARSDRRSGRLALLAVIAVFGVMLGVSALKTDQERPETEAERTELIAQIVKLQDEQADLSSAINSTSDEVTRLQSEVSDAVSRNSSIDQRVQALSADAGTVAMSGPGMVVTVDDAPAAASGSGGKVLDSDLQSLANALWAAGAEAVSINDHRLTTLTAIRFAGEAITVDNVSLSPPYVVDVIGDPDTLPARLLETDGGQTWLGLEANFGIRFDREVKDEVVVPADPHEHLLYAKPEGGR